jgi:hypothetical protein
MSLKLRGRGLACLAVPALATVAFAQGVDIWTVGVNNTRQGWNRLDTAPAVYATFSNKGRAVRV